MDLAGCHPLLPLFIEASPWGRTPNTLLGSAGEVSDLDCLIIQRLVEEEYQDKQGEENRV